MRPAAWMLCLSLVAAAGCESESDRAAKVASAAMARRKAALEMAAAAPLDRFTALVIDGERPVLGVKGPDGEALELSDQSFEAMACFAEGEACVVREGGLCGLLLKRTARLVVPVEHACAPGEVEGWTPCDGQCVRFKDGAAFVVKDGVATRFAGRPAAP